MKTVAPARLPAALAEEGGMCGRKTFNADLLLLYIKVIKREQKLVLMMMWRTRELIWLIVMDACLVRGGE